MKRLIPLLLALCFTLALTGASADSIDLSSLSETQLYTLYGQAVSQSLYLELKDTGSYSSVSSYEDFERNPTRHKGEKVRFSGKLIQVSEGYGRNVTYRVALNGRSSQFFIVEYTRPDKAERLLVDDEVTVYGTNEELYTYTSTTNKPVTAPCVTADLIIRTVTDKRVLSASATELKNAINRIPAQLKRVASKSSGSRKITKTTYDSYARHESLHKDDKITFTGKVLQSIENTTSNKYRIAVDSDSDRVIYVTIGADEGEFRILEDDTVTVTGSYDGLYSYSSTRGGTITIPSCDAASVKLSGYKAPASFPKDSKGNVKLTKALFEYYSRRPNEHLNEKITFSAKVLQVIEGSSSSEYRMAVDSDSSCVIYVTISNKDRATRVLEDDKVSVTAVFTGLVSYESTMNVKITIPQCKASGITVPGKSGGTAKAGTDGKYKVTKSSYDTFARNAESYRDQTLTFKAEVLQVVDDDGSYRLRLAVDSDYNCVFYATMTASKKKPRILEDDVVTVEGTCTGLYTYSSVRGGMITIPSCKITDVSIQGFKKGIIGTPTNGYYKITKSKYEQWARYPDLYKGKKISFRGKVVQVVERSWGPNVYRVAVDSDYGCMFYVEYTLAKGKSRILEGDVVNLQGTFEGAYTYTTTLGSSVTIPAIDATSMSK